MRDEAGEEATLCNMVQETSADMEYVNRTRATLCEVFLEATESCLWGFRVYQCEKTHGNVICLLRETFVTVGRVCFPFDRDNRGTFSAYP